MRAVGLPEEAELLYAVMANSPMCTYSMMLNHHHGHGQVHVHVGMFTRVGS